KAPVRFKPVTLGLIPFAFFGLDVSKTARRGFSNLLEQAFGPNQGKRSTPCRILLSREPSLPFATRPPDTILGSVTTLNLSKCSSGALHYLYNTPIANPASMVKSTTTAAAANW